MMFVNLYMTRESLREAEELSHHLILFGITHQTDPRGLPIYQAIASGDCPLTLGGVAADHHSGREGGKRVRGYVVYELEEVKKGMEFGEQEQRAGEN